MMADTPDFDSMTPEQIMEWMESLAKRQGATEGFTTAADMQVQEISAEDERLKDKKDYVPYGWKEEDWKAHLAKEEEQKKAKAAAQPAVPPPAPKPVVPVQPAAPPPPPPPAPVAAAPAPAADATPDFDKMSPDEIMKWMESLAKRQGATEGFTTAADMQVQDISADDERLKDKKDYVPYGWKEEDWKVHLAKEEEQKKAKAAAQAAAPIPPPAPKPVAPPPPPAPLPPPPVAAAPSSLDDFFSSLTANELPGLAEDEDDETVPTAASDNPMDWLAGLAGETDNSLQNFQPAELDDPLKALESLASGSDDLSDMNWLAALAGDTADSTDALANLSRLAAPEDPFEALSRLGSAATPPTTGPEPGADTIEWLESLARDQGADPAELTTNASLKVPPPSNFMPDGPGYDPYSFEAGGDFAAEAPLPVPAPDFSLFDADDEDLDMDNPEDWLDALAAGAGDTTPTKTMPPVQEAAVVDDVMARLNQAKEVSPEEIEGMFDALFKKAETFAHLDSQPAELVEPEIDEDDSSPISAEIPDWLQEQMVVAPPDVPGVGAQAAADIGAILEAPEPDNLPDWLQTPDDVAMPDFAVNNLIAEDEEMPADLLPDWLQTEDEETADMSNIFVDDEPTLPEQVKPVLELDTSDSLVLALKQEVENESELIAWYENQLQKATGVVAAPDVEELLEQAAPPEPVISVAGSALQAADLPLETELAAGEPENVPDWLLGEAAATVTITGDEGMPDWLLEATNEAEAVSVEPDMPDWLREQVGDTAEDDVDVPDWLQSAGTDVNMDEIPDWLLQTMTDEQNAVSADGVDFEPEPITMPAVVAPIQPPSRAISPAPIQPIAASINVQQTLQAARSKVSGKDIDGALLEYEAIVRANTSLDAVVSDLGKLVEDAAFKKNPAVYRVLGDSLMRRGNLQQALETYRRALNLL
jgi:hypothetical protein